MNERDLLRIAQWFFSTCQGFVDFTGTVDAVDDDKRERVLLVSLVDECGEVFGIAGFVRRGERNGAR